MTDPRGGLFIDSGDGRGPIHTDDMTETERAAQGLPPKLHPSETDPESAATPEAILIEDADHA